jgi:hypothetical protein
MCGQAQASGTSPIPTEPVQTTLAKPRTRIEMLGIEYIIAVIPTVGDLLGLIATENAFDVGSLNLVRLATASDGSTSWKIQSRLQSLGATIEAALPCQLAVRKDGVEPACSFS